MTPGAQIIAIHQARGWKPQPEVQDPKSLWDDVAIAKMMNALASPDYLSDLNAMHEAEKVLTEEQFRRYALRLRDVLMQSDDWISHTVAQVLHATAAQRAEAFLRTLNLWDDTK